MYSHGLLEAGRVVVYGPVRDGTGAWGLGVLHAESEEAALGMVLGDPAIRSGIVRLPSSARCRRGAAG